MFERVHFRECANKAESLLHHGFMRKMTRVLGVLAAFATASVMVSAQPALAAPATTTTTLASSANPSTVGQAVTLTATVVGDTPTGSVTFSEPAGALGSVGLTDGVASLVVSTWTAGTHAVTATYSGDSNNDSSAGSVTQTVVAPTPPPPPPPPVKPVKKPTVELRVSADKVEVGDRVKLTWRSQHADVVKASGDWRGKQKSKGTTEVRIGTRGKHVFKLTVRNAKGSKTAKVVVMASRKAKELDLVVTDELVTVGDKVPVTADGLAKGEEYRIRLNDKVISTGTADKHGHVAETIVITKATPEGEVPLSITGSNPGRVGTAVLNVLGETKLDVEVGSAEVPQNTEQTITVTGLLAGEEVTVTYGGKELVTGKADEDGLFTYSFDVGKKKGKKTVSVVGALPTRSGQATFTVTPGRDPGNGG
jgi:hypothetical protein